MPKSVDIETKRAEFIGASINVISEEGLSSATLRRVAQAAGCTTGSLTHYYPNRDALLLDTLRTVHDNAAGRMREVAARLRDPHDRLVAVLKESLPLDDERLKEWRVWLAFWAASMDDSALTKENERRYREWQDGLGGLLAPLIPAADLAGETADLLAFIDGLGVGVARQFVGRNAMKVAQEGCESAMGRYVARFQQV